LYEAANTDFENPLYTGKEEGLVQLGVKVDSDKSGDESS